MSFTDSYALYEIQQEAIRQLNEKRIDEKGNRA